MPSGPSAESPNRDEAHVQQRNADTSGQAHTSGSGQAHANGSGSGQAHTSGTPVGTYLPAGEYISTGAGHPECVTPAQNLHAGDHARPVDHENDAHGGYQAGDGGGSGGTSGAGGGAGAGGQYCPSANFTNSNQRGNERVFRNNNGSFRNGNGRSPSKVNRPSHNHQPAIARGNGATVNNQSASGNAHNPNGGTFATSPGGGGNNNNQSSNSAGGNVAGGGQNGNGWNTIRDRVRRYGASTEMLATNSHYPMYATTANMQGYGYVVNSMYGGGGDGTAMVASQSAPVYYSTDPQAQYAPMNDCAAIGAPMQQYIQSNTGTLCAVAPAQPLMSQALVPSRPTMTQSTSSPYGTIVQPSTTTLYLQSTPTSAQLGSTPTYAIYQQPQPNNGQQLMQSYNIFQIPTQQQHHQQQLSYVAQPVGQQPTTSYVSQQSAYQAILQSNIQTAGTTTQPQYMQIPCFGANGSNIYYAQQAAPMHQIGQAPQPQSQPPPQQQYAFQFGATPGLPQGATNNNGGVNAPQYVPMPGGALMPNGTSTSAQYQ